MFLLRLLVLSRLYHYFCSDLTTTFVTTFIIYLITLLPRLIFCDEFYHIFKLLFNVTLLKVFVWGKNSMVNGKSEIKKVYDEIDALCTITLKINPTEKKNGRSKENNQNYHFAPWDNIRKLRTLLLVFFLIDRSYTIMFLIDEIPNTFFTIV